MYDSATSREPPGFAVAFSIRVVVDDLDDRVLERPAMLGPARVVKANLRGARLAFGTELPERHHPADDRLRLRVEDVRGRDQREVLANVSLQRIGALRIDPLPRFCNHLLDEFRFPRFVALNRAHVHITHFCRSDRPSEVN